MEKLQPETELQDITQQLQKFIDQLSDTLIIDICKEVREANKQYRDLISLAADINARLNTK